MDANNFEEGQDRVLMFSAMAGGRTIQTSRLPTVSSIAVGNWDLSKLFDQLTVECSGKLVHPQWKHFHHMPLLRSEQTRLSNAIWRSWHMQVVRNRNPIYCGFHVVLPGMDSSHKSPQAVVLEGKYWRRRLDAVATEYRKFRLWHLNRKKKLRAGAGPEGWGGGVMDVSAMPQPTSQAQLGAGPEGLADFFIHTPQEGHTQGMDLSSMFQPGLNMLHHELEDILSKLEPMEALFPGPVVMEPHHVLSDPLLPHHLDQGSPPTLLSSGSSPVGSRLHLDRAGREGGGVFKVPHPLPYMVAPAGGQPHREDDPMRMSVSPPTFLDGKTGPSLEGMGESPIAKEVKQEPGESRRGYPFQPSLPTGYQTVPPSQHVSFGPSSRSFSAPTFPALPDPVAMAPAEPHPPSDAVVRPFSSTLYDEKAQMHKSIEQLQKLERQQLQQLRDMERQKQLVQEEARRLLNQLLSSSKAPCSVPQQQLLQKVAADPTTLGILQDVMLQAQVAMVQGEGTTTPTTPSLPPQPQQSFGTAPPQFFSTPTSASSVQIPHQTAPELGIEVKTESPVCVAAARDPPEDSALLSMLATPPQGEASPQSQAFDSPTLTVKNRILKDLSPGEQRHYKEFRRRSHISAEQKRRGNIKNGFDRLQMFVSNLSGPSNTKLSKASVLLKSIEYTQHLQREKASQEKEIEDLKRRLEELNIAVNMYQEQLPVSGAPVTTHKFEENKRRFQDYICARTLHNYKFYLFGVIVQQLFDSYNMAVTNPSSYEELCHTILTWMDQNCSLPQLRRVGLEGLRVISKDTCILSDPAKVQQQITEMVARKQHHFGPP